MAMTLRMARLRPPSALDVINAVAPRRDVRFIGDLSYGSGLRHAVDLYLPRRIEAPAPVVVFYYGGGWESGDRADYRFVGAALAARGCIVVVPDYRLHPDVDYRGFLSDGAAAFVWARAAIGEHGGDTSRMLAMGHSAGAYIAAMLTLDPRWLAESGPDGLIGIAGPYDFVADTPALQAIFPTGDQRLVAMPIAYPRPGAPPALLVSGAADRTVLPANTMRLAAVLREVGAGVTERHYPRIGHRLVIGALARPLQLTAPVLADCLRFVATLPARNTI